MRSTLASLLICLSAAGSTAAGATGAAASGERRFLAKSQGEGQQCGSDGHFYGDCPSGLECVPPAEGAAVGAPSICHKVCGSFGPDGDKVNSTCSDGQTCSGRAATSCRERAGECYLYCAGQQASSSTSGDGEESGGVNMSYPARKAAENPWPKDLIVPKNWSYNSTASPQDVDVAGVECTCCCQHEKDNHWVCEEHSLDCQLEEFDTCNDKEVYRGTVHFDFWKRPLSGCWIWKGGREDWCGKFNGRTGQRCGRVLGHIIR